MGAIDMRTVFTSYLLVSVVCALVIASLWRANRDRSAGIGYWLADYVLQTTGILLIVLRGQIPDFISIVVANLMIYGGTVLLYVGLQQYLGKHTRQWHNVVALSVYGVVQVYFAFFEPNLVARNINGSLILAFLSAQAAWLTIRAVDPEIKSTSWPIGTVMLGFVAASILRIIADVNGGTVVGVFDSPFPDAAIVLANQLLYIGLTFALVLMVNRRLLLALAADIKRRMTIEDELRKSESKFSAAFQTIPDAVILAVVETGEILEVNESFYRVTGHTPETVAGNTSLALGLWPNAADREQFIARLEREGRVDRIDALFRGANGEIYTAELSAEVLNIDGVECLLSVSRDVTDDRLAKAQLVERIRELMRSNKDLEQFAYVASHDLQEPLRMVVNFTQLLQKRYTGKLDSDADDFLGFVLEGAQRMNVLITELLAYSRVQTTGKDLQRIELASVFDQATRFLTMAIAESGAKVTHDDLPSVLADEVQMQQVFQNLIGNALKFRGPDAPRIHVGAEREGDIWTISVKDNGIGIAPEYFDQVFQIYRRLQPQADYPGAGMGLAICKRIIERHGQRIWVESAPGEGSTFFFTLAAAPE